MLSFLMLDSSDWDLNSHLYSGDWHLAGKADQLTLKLPVDPWQYLPKSWKACSGQLVHDRCGLPGVGIYLLRAVVAYRGRKTTSVFQGWICLDSFACGHTERKLAYSTWNLTLSKYIDTRWRNPCTDPSTPLNKHHLSVKRIVEVSSTRWLIVCLCACLGECSLGFSISVLINSNCLFDLVVSADNKRDRRTIEEVLAETRAKKRMRTEQGPSSQTDETEKAVLTSSETQPSSTASESPSWWLDCQRLPSLLILLWTRMVFFRFSFGA